MRSRSPSWRPSPPRSLPRRLFSWIARVRARRAGHVGLFRVACLARPRHVSHRSSMSLIFRISFGSLITAPPSPSARCRASGKNSCVSGVARRFPPLVPPWQHHVLVAVEAGSRAPSARSGLLAFFHNRPRESATKCGFARRRRLGERLAGHSGEASTPFCSGNLWAIGNEAVLVPLTSLKPVLCHRRPPIQKPDFDPTLCMYSFGAAAHGENSPK